MFYENIKTNTSLITKLCYDQWLFIKMKISSIVVKKLFLLIKRKKFYVTLK